MSRTSGTDGPEDVDATFAKIVADLRAEGFGADGDDADDLLLDANDDEDGRAGRGTPRSNRDRELPAPSSSGWRESGTDWDETMLGDDRANAEPDDDDEHFVPPEPPPLPRPRKGAIVVLLFFVVGVLLLAAPGVIGLARSVALPLGMLSLATGIALALLRVRQGPPDGADPTNGAQV